MKYQEVYKMMKKAALSGWGQTKSFNWKNLFSNPFTNRGATVAGNVGKRLGSTITGAKNALGLNIGEYVGAEWDPSKNGGIRTLEYRYPMPTWDDPNPKVPWTNSKDIPESERSTFFTDANPEWKRLMEALHTPKQPVQQQKPLGGGIAAAGQAGISAANPIQSTPGKGIAQAGINGVGTVKPQQSIAATNSRPGIAAPWQLASQYKS